jgi:IS30 family transposase
LIGVSPSAVSRELQRNKDKRGGYSWRLAHETIYKWIREDKKAGGVLQGLSTRQIEADTAQAE